MYSRKSGWSANPPRTGAHVTFGSHWVIAWPVLLCDWTYLVFGIGINGLTSVKGDKTDLKSQNTVTEWTAWGFPWPSLVLRCLVSRFIYSCVVTQFSPKDLCEGYIENSVPALVVSLLWFSRDLRGPNLLILSPLIVNWLLNPCARFEPTFSTPDTFQVQILSEIYDKARVNRRKKGEFRFCLVDFVPFLKFCIVEGHVVVTIKKTRDWVPVLVFRFSWVKSFFFE